MKTPNSLQITLKPGVEFDKPKEWKESLISIALDMAKVVPVIIAVSNLSITSLITPFKKHDVVNLAQLCKEKKFE
jgi:hypothetical protein